MLKDITLGQYFPGKSPIHLMDPRTISRRDMREQVNQYMRTVLQEEPLDPSLVDFEDDLAW